MASNNGHVRVVNVLVDAGAKVDVRDGFVCFCVCVCVANVCLCLCCVQKRTPLMLATKAKHLEVMDVLMKAGADVNAKDKVSLMLLMCCCDHRTDIMCCNMQFNQACLMY